mmetsp:Transcript_52282/g.114763  ORF Transcript_52282/g.114763 Transcript_52282/m.114763 type:complete len:273 (-) Transcript_52282:1313-2131(-)
MSAAVEDSPVRMFEVPLNMTTPTCPVVGPRFIFATKALTKAFCISNPSVVADPEPSMMNTRSIIASHLGSAGHTCSLHFWNRSRAGSCQPGQEALAPSGSWATRRWENLTPVSQALVQWVHWLHGPRVHSDSHLSWLHMRLSWVSPHGIPLYWGSCSTSRIRIWLPPPQGLEHWLHPDHSPSTQSMGQECWLQGFFMARGGQAAPILAWTTTSRVITIVPPPQEEEQAFSRHSLTSQSWIHGLLLSSRYSSLRMRLSPHICPRNSVIFSWQS